MSSHPIKPFGSLDAGMLARRGFARRTPIVFAPSAPDPVAEVAEAVEVPEVLRQVERLAQALAGTAPAAQAEPGRKIAFTLRLDSARHARLRGVVAAEGRSAQQVLIEALDHYLHSAALAAPSTLHPVPHRPSPTGTRP